MKTDIKFDMKLMFNKIVPACFFGLGGLVMGLIVGGLFGAIGVASYIPWEEVFIFFGGILGFFMGFLIDDDE